MGADLTETTYSNLRASLATILDRVANDREVVVVKHRGVKTVAMLPADELSGLLETAHLLRSPKNAQRLLKALHRLRWKPFRQQALHRAEQWIAERIGDASDGLGAIFPAIGI